MSELAANALSDPLTLIHHLSRRAIEVDDAQVLLDEMNQAAMEATGADRAFVAIAHDATGELTLMSTAGIGWTSEFRALRLKIGESGRRKNGDQARQRHHVPCRGHRAALCHRRCQR